MEILKELYCGDIRPSERTVKERSDYKKVQAEACTLEDAFLAELSDKGKEAYEAFMVKLLSLTETENCDSFIKGYRLGTKLLLAALLDYDTPLPQVSEG